MRNLPLREGPAEGRRGEAGAEVPLAASVPEAVGRDVRGQHPAAAEKLPDWFPGIGSDGLDIVVPRPLPNLEVQENGASALIRFADRRSDPGSDWNLWCKRLALASECEGSRVAIVGRPELGSYRTRAKWLSAATKWTLLGDRIPDSTYDTIIVCKETNHWPTLRQLAGKLIFDPLDSFYAGPSRHPVNYWRSHPANRFADSWWATSPACADTMRAAGIESVSVVPHQCDPRIRPMRFDPLGPLAYWGQGCFLDNGGAEECEAAYQRPIRRADFPGWYGCSAVCGYRSKRFQGVMTRHCKPQIKLANAIAAGLPFVTTDLEAAISLSEFWAEYLKNVVDSTHSTLSNLR